MCTRTRTVALLAASLLALGAVACGDDDTDDSVTAAETTDDGTASDGTAGDATDESGENGDDGDAAGDPADPCSLLTEDDFASVLEVSVDEPEDVSDSFIVAGPEVESHACQWEATTTGDGVAVSVYSVELVTVPDDADGDVYADAVDNADFFDAEVSDLDVGDEAVGVDDGGSPEILASTGDVFMMLSTASDDLTVDDLLPLATAALGRVEAG